MVIAFLSAECEPMGVLRCSQHHHPKLLAKRTYSSASAYALQTTCAAHWVEAFDLLPVR